MKTFFYAVALTFVIFWGIALTGQFPRRLSDAQLKKALSIAVSIVELKDAINGVPIEVEEIDRLVEKGRRIIWLDCRPEKERSVSWIPGSRPAAGFAVDSIKQDQEVAVVYDTIGADALPLALELNSRRDLKAVVRSLRGGTVAWALAGKEFETPEGLARTVRLSSALWNFVPRNYKVSW